MFVCAFCTENLLFLTNGSSTLYILDNIHTVKPLADIVLLGNFNIDLLKPHSSWDSYYYTARRNPLLKSPTRIIQTSATLIDPNYIHKQPRR